MNGHGFMSSADAHRECWDLLPWLANERATAKDHARMDAHLRDCAECQEELANQRRLRDAVRAEEAVVIAPQASLQKLMQRIDAEDREATSVEPDADVVHISPAPVVAAARPRWFAIAAAVQGIAILGLLAALWMQARESLEAPRFTTLTSHAVVPRGPVIRVVFADGVALADVNSILRSIDAQIVAGPSEAGVYTLSLSTGRSSSVDAALLRLRADGRVAFSEAALVQSESR